jgi:NADPH:quinone reductase-like Zn-dependent oxidoreductase
VKVRATSVNPVDVKLRANDAMLTAFLGSARPAFLGYDFAGDVVAKAAGVAGVAVGEAVFGFMPIDRASAYAEYVAVPANIIASKPANVSYEAAAVTTVAAVTAWNPLVNEFRVKPGDKVLIIAGSGGVGHFAIQIAKHFGATVSATSSAKNRDFILALGADHHVDYTMPDYWQALTGMDFVLDTMGGETLEHCLAMTKDGGRIITTVPAPAAQLVAQAHERQIDVQFGGSRYGSEDLTALAGLLSQGIIRPHISATYAFAQMPAAHTQLETGRTVGKVVVTL